MVRAFVTNHFIHRNTVRFRSVPARDEHEEIVVKHYGAPVAVLISFSEYEELLRLRRGEKRRNVLLALDRLRKDVQSQSPPLSAEEAYRLAGFDEDVVQSTLGKDRELASPEALLSQTTV